MLRRILLLSGLLLIAACQDLPTAPEGSARASDREQAIVLEPVVVVGKCDPLTSLDWCGGGGDCMTSTGDVQVVQGCYDSGGVGGGGGTSPGGGGGGGGGGTTGPTSPSTGDPDDPCPIEDPECMQEMSQGQKEAVNIAKSMFRTQFTDPAAQQACTAMANALATLPIYQGNPLLDDAEGASHSGQYQNGAIHIDADWFDQAISMGDYRAIGFLLLHEAAHSLGYRHVGETRAPYSTVPFNFVSPGSGAETCIE